MNFSIFDILYALFRRKWWILGCAVLGLAGAAVAYIKLDPSYVSTAKVMVRYVMEERDLMEIGDSTEVRAPFYGATSLIDGEVQIMASMDLIEGVVQKLTPEKILSGVDSLEAEVSEFTEIDASSAKEAMAAKYVMDHLSISVPSRSNVIRINFTHPNPFVPQEVLNELIDLYLVKHLEIHRSIGDEATLLVRIEELKMKLREEENKIQEVRAASGVAGFRDSLEIVSKQIGKLETDLTEAKTQLALRGAKVEQLKQWESADSAAIETNETQTVEPRAAGAHQPSRENLSLMEQLMALKNKEIQLLSQFKEDNILVRQVRKQIEDIERWVGPEALNSMRLNSRIGTRISSPTAALTLAELREYDLKTEEADVGALKAQTNSLHRQLVQFHDEALALEKVSSQLKRLERNKAVHEENLNYFQTKLEKAKVDQAVQAGRQSNISIIQNASFPIPYSNAAKFALAILALGIVGGLGLAVVWEVFLNPNLKMPAEIEQKLQLPLALVIPRFSWRQKRRMLPKIKSIRHWRKNTVSEHLIVKNGVNLNPYFESLRDQLIADFEMRQLKHKPKLVAITSCQPRSGNTTISTGLATLLSETGGGRVLLVDLTNKNGSAQTFMNGKPSYGLDEALNGEDGQENAIDGRENLVLATTSKEQNDKRLSLPRIFYDLIPKFKASNYDYILFDMPPADQISVTSKLACLMDKVYLVVDSEKTSRQKAGHARQRLAKVNDEIAVIFNRHQNWVPMVNLAEDI